MSNIFNFNTQVLDSLKSGNEALKKMHSIMTIEDIEKILDETQEGIEKQREIDGLLSNNLSPEDLEEVETELEKIMAEENVIQKESPLSPADSEVVSLPEVPETPLAELEPGKPIKKFIKRNELISYLDNNAL